MRTQARQRLVCARNGLDALSKVVALEECMHTVVGLVRAAAPDAGKLVDPVVAHLSGQGVGGAAEP